MEFPCFNVLLLVFRMGVRAWVAVTVCLIRMKTIKTIFASPLTTLGSGPRSKRVFT